MELAYIQIMSVGFPIDVTRLLGDNQRFHRQLAMAQQQNHQLRNQLDQALASNEAIRAECEQLQRQKQGELNNFIANHQELYQSELATLRQERQQLMAKVQQLDEAQPNPRLEQTIKQLTQQIKRHETEKAAMEKDLVELRRLTTAQQQEIHRRLNHDIAKKELKIKELEAINADLLDTQRQIREELDQERTERTIKEQNYVQLQQRFTRLENNWNSLSEKTSVDILAELIQLRSQSLQLQKQANSIQLANFANDQQVYSLLQRLYEEQAALRYQLTEARNATSQQEISFQNERAQFRNECAQKQLLVLKQEKELQYFKQQEQQNKFKLQQLQQQLVARKEDTLAREKIDEEIALLKIKVFVLESLRGSQKYHRQSDQDVDYNKFQAQFEAFGAFKLKSSRAEVLNNVASMHVAMTETLEQLKEEEAKRREAVRKSKDYKLRWEAATRKETEAIRALERIREKESQYQRLIERMQSELEKAYLASQGSDKHSLTSLVSSYKQKLHLANKELSSLQTQLRECTANAQLDKISLEKEMQKLIAQYKQMEQTHNQLLQKNRTLETKILQQSLSSATNKAGKNFQAELAQKTAALILTEQEMQGLREQLATIKEANMQQATTIGKLQEEVSRLKRQLSSPNLSSASGFHQELSQLQKKLAYLEGMLGEQRQANNASNESHIRTLYQQIAKLKTETQETSLDKSGRHHTETEIQSYRGRLIELEDTLRSIANENEEKSLEIYRLNEENNLLSKQLGKIEEELDLLRGKAGSMREIDLIDRNKQLQEEAEEIRKELINAKEALQTRTQQLEAVKKECEEYWGDNLKLLVIIKENNIQLKENKFLSEKYDQEVTYRQQHLEAKIQSLQNDNQILKNLVEDLRKSILDRQSAKEHEDTSNRVDLEDFKKQLEAKEKQNIYLQQELNHLHEERAREKEAFDHEWNKLFNELNDLRHELEEERRKASSPKERIKPVTFDEESRIHIISAPDSSDDMTLKALRSTIATLQNDLSAKNERIYQLESQLRQMQYSMKSSGIYSQEVVQLRNQVQGLLEARFELEDKIRVLQQENSLLKIHKFSENVDNHDDVFRHQTFGPSFGTNQLIQQLRDTEEAHIEPNTAEIRSWNSRYEQVLCLLVISFAEIESLRNNNEQLQERINQCSQEYTERLRHIEDSFNSRQSTYADTNLVKELECGHRHLVKLTQLGLQQGKLGLAQLGSFTESITGGKMIESYSVREEDESVASQQVIPT